MTKKIHELLELFQVVNSYNNSLSHLEIFDTELFNNELENELLENEHTIRQAYNNTFDQHY